MFKVAVLPGDGIGPEVVGEESESAAETVRELLGPVRFPGDGHQLGAVPAHRKAAHRGGRGTAEEVRHHLPRSGRGRPGQARGAGERHPPGPAVPVRPVHQPPACPHVEAVRAAEAGHGLQHRCVPREHRGLLRGRRWKGPGRARKAEPADQAEPLRHEGAAPGRLGRQGRVRLRDRDDVAQEHRAVRRFLPFVRQDDRGKEDHRHRQGERMQQHLWVVEGRLDGEVQAGQRGPQLHVLSTQ